MISNLYRLAVVKAAVSALKSLNECQREQATSDGPLAPLLALAHSSLRDSPFFCDDQPPSSPFANRNHAWSVNDVACEVNISIIYFCYTTHCIYC